MIWNGPERAVDIGYQRLLGEKPTTERTLHRFVSLAANKRNLLVHSGDLNTLLRGVVERVAGRVVDDDLLPPLRASFTMLTDCQLFMSRLKAQLPKLSPYTRQQVVECYTAQKRLRYEQAKESLESRPLERQDACQKVFVKAEVIVYDGVAESKKPRIIRPRDPRFNIELGRFVKSCEKSVYSALDRMCGGTTVVKGLNAEQTAMAISEAWDSFASPVCIGLDASHADQSFRSPQSKMMTSLYVHMFGADPDLLRLEDWRAYHPRPGGEQVLKARTRDGKLTAKGEFGMASGDMDTSLGMNVCMVALAWTLLKHLGIRARIIVNGDDHLILTERKHETLVTSQVKGWYLLFGFSIKPEPPVYSMYDVDFCQCRPCWDGRTWIMVRDIRKSLIKDLHTLQPVNDEKSHDFFRKAKADCGLALAGNLPILGAFYRMLGRGATCRDTSSQRQVISGMNFMAAGLDRRHGDVSPEARLSFYLTYDITPDEQRALEKRYDAITPSWSTPAPREETTDPAFEEIINKH